MSFRCLYLLFFSCCCSFSLWAQHKPNSYTLAQLDSLIIALREAQAFDEMETPIAQGLLLTKQSTDTFSIKFRYQKAYLLAKKNEYAAADSLNNICLQLLERYHPKWLGFKFRILFQSANALSDQGKNQQAKALLVQALSLKTEEDLDQGKVFNNLGLVCADLGQYAEAEKYHQKAYALRSKIQGPEHLNTARSLNNLGNVYRSQGKYSQAIQTYQKTLQIYEKTSLQGSLHYTQTLQNLAICFEESGSFEQAEALYLRTLALQKESVGDQDLEYAKTEMNLATFYWLVQQFTQGEALYRSALAKFENLLGPENPYQAQIMANLGLFYLSQNNFQEAQKLYEKALDLRRQTQGEQTLSYLKTLHSLGNLYFAKGDYPQALNHYTQVKTGYLRKLGQDHPEYAHVLMDLANVYDQLKDGEQAKALNLQALAILEKRLEPQHSSILTTHNKLANIAFEQNDAANFGLSLQKALSLNAGLSLSLQPSAAWRDSLRQASFSDPQEALTSLDLLQQSLPSARAKGLIIEAALDLLNQIQGNFGNDEDKLKSLNETHRWVIQGLGLLDPQKQAQEAFSLAEVSKSVLLLQSIRTDKAYRFGALPADLAKKEQTLQQEHLRLKAQLQERRPEAQKQELQQQLSQVNQATLVFKKQIEAEFPQYANLKYKTERLQAAQIQQMLPPKTALIEYIIAPEQVYILWVSKQEVKMWVQPLRKDSLERQIARLHRNLSQYEDIQQQASKVYADYTRLGHWFYTQLLQPVLAKESDTEHLIIIPDGDLANLPFEAFLTEAPSPGLAYAKMPYLLRRYRLSYSYSAGLWRENRQQGIKANNGQILAMAPSYQQKDSTVFRAPRLPSHRLLRQKLLPLPSARQEVEALSRLFAGHFAFDSLATEQQFKQGAERYAVIHLALHGLLDQKNPLLSSLAFTEDGDSLENNLLQVFEISQMRFQANLVVLSACETGFGRFEQGNGTASLARAFMYAGVPALVVSLWQVNDASTAFIMEQFYRNLDQGMDKAKALQEAKLSYMEYYDDPQAAHPAFWASFIQLGDASPINLQRKSSYWWWVWIGAAALLSLLGWLGWKRRR